jgi:sulfatase maturation enzyme AslB (radical SAM superfamily)
MSNTFCILPWIHLYVHPTGDVLPCCTSWIGNDHSVIGTVDTPLEELFNRPFIKQLRLDMLNEVSRPDVCTKCYIKDRSGVESNRQQSNIRFKNIIEDLKSQTTANGFVEPKLKFWDIRFSNLCNLKCRSCNPALSSSIAVERNLPVIKIKDVSKDNDILKNQYSEVTDIYFAGGEPLIMSEHYEVLEKLIDLGRSDQITINYSSNVTNLKYKNKDIISLWNQFKQVSVIASIDAYGSRAEYIRHGVKWNQIEDNLRTLVGLHRTDSNFNLGYSATVSILNIWHLTDLHNYLIEKDLLDNNFMFTPLILPPHLSITNLPNDIKLNISKKIEAHIKTVNASYAQKYKILLDFLNLEGNHNLFIRFLAETASIDKIRNESFYNTFPEYKKIL